MDLDIVNNAHLFEDLHLTTIFISAIMTNPILGFISIAVTEYIYFPREEKKFEDMICEHVMKTTKLLQTNEETKNIPFATTIALRHLSRKTKGRELKQELIELLYVGAHTIGVSTCSALVYLATHPDIQEKVWKEQKEIFGDSERDPTYDDLKKMEYLERFYKEVLRFVAPPIITKTATADVNIGGMIIPEGALVTINSRRMRFDGRYWDNPYKFEPDRFLDENISRVPKSAYAFFGYGVRICPGYQYANYSIKVMLSTIVRNFKLHSTMKFNEIKYNALLMMEMKGGFNISVEKRNR